MGLGIPPLQIKTMLESNPPKSTMLAGRLGVIILLLITGLITHNNTTYIYIYIYYVLCIIIIKCIVIIITIFMCVYYDCGQEAALRRPGLGGPRHGQGVPVATHTYIYIYIHIHTHMCIYIYVYMCVYICIYIYITV